MEEFGTQTFGGSEVSYPTRTPLPAHELKAGKSTARQQREVVLEIFRGNSYRDFTPSEIWGKTSVSWCWPLTSIRRAITNLTKENPSKLIHQPHIRRMGLCGKTESTWKYAAPTFKIGSLVNVPAVPENISWLYASGRVVAIEGNFAKVLIRYGRQTGYWDGLISELELLE
jgi:hypothetical protein